jgi:hypothetical protein
VFFDPGNPESVALLYKVTDPGDSWSLDALDPARHMKLGWIALFDNYDGNPAIPDGDYLHQPIFLEWLGGWLQGFFLGDLTTGASGFVYNLQDDVEVTFYWYY